MKDYTASIFFIFGFRKRRVDSFFFPSRQSINLVAAIEFQIPNADVVEMLNAMHQLHFLWLQVQIVQNLCEAVISESLPNGQNVIGSIFRILLEHCSGHVHD